MSENEENIEGFISSSALDEHAKQSYYRTIKDVINSNENKKT